MTGWNFFPVVLTPSLKKKSKQKKTQFFFQIRYLYCSTGNLKFRLHEYNGQSLTNFFVYRINVGLTIISPFYNVFEITKVHVLSCWFYLELGNRLKMKKKNEKWKYKVRDNTFSKLREFIIHTPYSTARSQNPPAALFVSDNNLESTETY